MTGLMVIGGMGAERWIDPIPAMSPQVEQATTVRVLAAYGGGSA